MSNVRVAVAGATGYAGEALVQLLLAHPNVQLTCLAASAKWERPVSFSEIFPRFARQIDLPVESLDPERLSASADVIFLALPHRSAMGLVPSLLDAGKRVIDLSGDFRLRDPALYPAWYTFDHSHPELLQDARTAYGLTEFHREELSRARLVANPGCYATSILLGSLPLFAAGVVEDGCLIVDAKSGLSGAGRKADPSLLFSEMAENLRSYKVNSHQHMPEVLQELGARAGCRARMTFVPQVIPVTRGLVSMIYVKSRVTTEALEDLYRTSYPADRTPFIRVRPRSLPQLRDVIETNFCDIGFTCDPSTGYVIIVSALDNLLKGAAGQAVQNLNVMLGWPETTGLL